MLRRIPDTSRGKEHPAASRGGWNAPPFLKPPRMGRDPRAPQLLQNKADTPKGESNVLPYGPSLPLSALWLPGGPPN